ncbi:MAG TPA: hypothetical protein VGD45_05085 [Steroidobacter sp.]|uniref:hypothetical protein n=1 Tax=Steroidobacter sp. TaxID=1978227 RepID=UPI002EDB89BD
MTLSKGRTAARFGRLELEQILDDGLVEELKRHSSSDGETFHLSVQFALAHGVRRAHPRSQITTLRSSTLLSGASSR